MLGRSQMGIPYSKEWAKMELEGQGPYDQGFQVSGSNSSFKGICRSNVKIKGHCRDQETFIDFENLPGAKERFTKAQSDSRYQETQSSHNLSEVQDDYCFRYQRDASSRGLDGFNRPKRSLLPHTHTSKLPEVPGVLYRGASFQICGNAIRPQCSTKNFYQNYECAHSPSQTERHISNCILGRLVNLGKVQGNMQKEPQSMHRLNREDGFYHKPKQIIPNTIPEGEVFRSSLVFNNEHYCPAGGDAKQVSPSNSLLQEKSIHIKERIGETSGASQFCDHDQSGFQTKIESITSLSKGSGNQVEKRSTGSLSSSIESKSDLMEGRRVSTEDHVEVAQSLPRPVHGCLHNWMGFSYLRRPFRSGDMDHVKKFAYKCKRADSSLPCNQEIKVPQEHYNKPVLRQPGRGCGSEERRFLQIDSHQVLGAIDSNFEEKEKPFHKSFPYHGLQQRLGRPSVQKSPSSDRMVLKPSGFSSDCGEMGIASSRPVCYQGQQEVGDFHFSISRPSSSRSGCDEVRLESMDESVHFSSDCYDFEGFEETRDLQRRDYSDCSLLANAKVVSSVIGQVRRDIHFSKSSSLPGGPREGTLGSEYPRKESSRVSFLRELEIPLVGVRGSVLMSMALRKSSSNKYDAVWDSFVKFLYDNQCPPIDINCVAKYLIYLFDVKNLRPNTIASYKCALSLPLKKAFNLELNDYPFPALLKGMWNERPSLPPRDPDWSLDNVLNFLSTNKFCNPDFLDLTHKCVFLFTLATANRISEVHSYLRDKNHIVFGKDLDYVKIIPNAAFLAKNELPSRRRKPFIIKALKVKGKHSPVCPVLCLSMYIKAARAYPSKFLFVNPRTGRHCSKYVLTQMIIRTVKWACPDSFPKAHDVRKVSSTRAFLNRMSMQAIKKRGSWRSGAVFAKHYLAKSFLSSKRCVVMGSST